MFKGKTINTCVPTIQFRKKLVTFIVPLKLSSSHSFFFPLRGNHYPDLCVNFFFFLLFSVPAPNIFASLNNRWFNFAVF